MNQSLLHNIKLLFLVAIALFNGYLAKAEHRALPTVILSMPLKSNSTTANLTVTFSEPVLGLRASDFSLSGIPGAYVDNNIPSYPITSYTAIVHFPIGVTGVLSVSLPAASVSNSQSEMNVASDTVNISVDNVAPVVTAVNVPIGREYKTGDDLDFWVDFSEIVITNPLGQVPYLPVTIGSKQLLLPMYAGVGWSNMLFKYTIQPGDQDLDGIEIGAVLTMPSGTIRDTSGNIAVMTLSNVADSRGVLVNSSYPTVDLSGPSASAVNAPFEVLVVFSDFVSGLTASDFTVVNATVSEPRTTDSVNYFIDVTPVTDGPLSIFLPANAAVNKGPNGNIASNQIDLTADLTAPTITKVDFPAAGKYGTTNTLDFTVHFSENVIVGVNNGSPALAINIGGQTVMADFSAWVGNDALAFSYQIQDGDMDLDGIVLGASLLLNGARIRDAGRNNANLTLPGGIDLSGITINTVRPTAVLSTTIDSLVNNPFTVTLVFSEPVTGVTESSFQTTNLNFDAITTTDNIHYTLAVAANYNGPVKLSLLQDGAVNSYSTGSMASNEISLMGDFTSPKITSLGLPVTGTYGIGTALDFTVQYNEVVYVTTTGGTPNIPVTIGTKAVKALYVSGSGTNTVVYRYVVKEGEKDADGIVLGRDIAWGGGRVQDLAGNDALTRLPANNPVNITVNAIRPTVVLSTPAPAILKNPFTVTAVFSEAVSGLTGAGFTTVNATVSNLQTTDNITYTATITPLGDGVVKVSLPKDAAVSALQNGNAASNQLSVTADFTPPVITQIDLPAKGYYHTGDKLTFVVHFSEEVAIDVSNGNYNLAIYINSGWAPAFYNGVSTANTMTFTYTILDGDMANGIVFDQKLIGAGNETIRDSLGNNANINIPANIDGSGIFVNAVQPGVVLSTAAANTVSHPFTVTAVFTEAVTGLVETDFSATNASVSNLQTTDNITYTLLVTPTSEGTVSVTLPAGTANTTTGIDNTASNIISVNADMTAPVVTQVSVPANGYYHAAGSLSFLVEYGENVVVNTTNGTPSLPVTIGGTTVPAQYTSGSGSSQLIFEYVVQNGDTDMDGIVIGNSFSLNNGTIKDEAGNDAALALNNVAATAGVFVNTTHPAVTLSTTAPAVLNNSFIVTAVFSEAVTGLGLAGFNLVNANSATLTTTDNITYTVEITPMTNGPVSVSLAADAAVNAGQNGNTASNQIDVIADFRAPKVTQVIIPGSGYYNATQTLSFFVTYDEKVIVDTTRGVPLMAVNMDMATVPVEYRGGSGTNTLVFSYAIQDGDADVDGISISPAISLGAGATIQDAAGNDVNLIFPGFLDGRGILVNTTHPDVVLSTTAGAAVNAPFTVKAVFTEAVTGVTATDFTVTNAAASNLQTTDNITYTVSITPTADGAVTVLLPANIAENIGRNGNPASNTISVTADITAPEITQVDVPANGYYKAGSTLTFALKYSEPVLVNTTAGKPAIGINIGGVKVPAVYATGSGTAVLNFSYTISNGDMDMDGISLYNGMVMNGSTIKDVTGNYALTILNNIAPTSGIFVNTTHPTVVLSTAAVSPVNAPFTVTAVFSEAVTGLTMGSFSLTNASGSTLQTVDKISYTLYITPTANGAVGVSLPADVAVNIGNNGNTASNAISVMADVTAPVVTEVTVPANGYYKAGNSLKFTVKYSEPVIVNGSPAFPVNIGGTSVSAVYTGGTGTPLLSFSYTVQNGDQDMDGITPGTTLLLNGATIRDTADNNASSALNNIAPANSVFVNTAHPAVTLSTTAVTANTSFMVTAVFSEVVAGLTAADFTVTNGSVSNLQTTDNITYTILVTPITDGAIGISLPADAAINIGNNGSTASNTISVTADITAPVIPEVVVPVNGYYKAGSTLHFTVKYSEDVMVTGTPAIPVNIGGTNVSAVYTGGTGTQLLSFSYTVQSGDLDMDGITLGTSLLLNGATIKDATNNTASLTLNNIGNTSGVFVNTVHPTVTLSTTAAGTINAPFTVNVVFSEAVTGLSMGDFSLINATAATLQTTDNITYTIVITSAADGPVSVSLPADAAVNIGSNGNTGSNTISVTADVSAPVVTEVSVPSNGYYKAGSTLNFTVKYSEDVMVTGIPVIPVNIGGTNVSAVYTGGSSTQLLSFSYTVQNGDLDMDGITLGTSLLLNGGTIKDATNNTASLTLNNIGNTSGVFVNTVHPTVTLSTTAAGTINTPFTVNVVFSEAITGLSGGEFSLVNATAATLQTTDNITYTIVITPAADGPVSVALPADAAVNIGNNGNTGSNTISVTADVSAPLVTEVSVPSNGYYKAGSTLNFTVKYSEDVMVTGTPAIPVNIRGTNVSAVYTGGTGTQLLSFSYTVQSGDLDMDGITLGTSLLLNGGATIKDVTNNTASLTLNNIGNTSGVFVNTVHPTVTLSTTAVGTINTPFTVNVVFSEAVTGLSVSDFSLINATAATLQTTDNITYTIVITPAADGPVSVSLPADAAVNIGNNGNTGSNTISVTADVSAPLVTQVSVPSNGYYKAGSTLNFTVTYSEDVMVTGTPVIPVNIGGTNVSAVYTGGSGTQLLSFSYTVQNGDLDMDGITLGASLLLNGGTIKDATNNVASLLLNNIGNTSGVFVNTVHPAVTLSTTAVGTINAPFTVNVVFSEAVTGLSAGDFSLVNATAATPQTTDNITYTIVITPAADGAVSVSLPADEAVNIGNNGNTGSNTISVTADVSAPVVTQVSVPSNGYYKAGSTLNFTVKYSEKVMVTGTPAIPVNIGGTNVSAVYTGGSGTQLLSFSYTVQSSDLDMDGITLGTSLLLNGGATIKDVTNNAASLLLNNIGNTSGVFVNTVHPTATLSTTVAGTINAPFTVNVVFSEAVTGLSAGDFSLINATAATPQTTDNITYTIVITPAADGPVSISLPADAALNIGSNGNTVSNTLTTIADLTAPVINAGQAFNVNEHSAVGTTAGTLAAIETGGTLQHWTITTDGSGGAFAIDAATGTITVKDKTILDSKVNTTITLTVTVSDGLNTSAPETVSIRIVPVVLPPTDINIDNNTINERSPAGTIVGALSAVSADPAATFTYSLVTGTGSTDNNGFRIVGNQLQTAAVLSAGVMSIRVQATGNNGLSVEKVLIITVNPVNQAPVMDVINDQQVCNVSEVQTLQLTGASPVEAGQTLTYTITADQSYFSSLTVNNTGLISYSTKTGVSGEVNVTVTVKDNGGTAHGGVDFLQRTFKVTVNSLPVVTITSDKGNTIAKGDVIQLTASGGDTYSWANADGIISGQQEAVLKVKQLATTTYLVTATNGNGCSNTGKITITVAEGIKVDASNILTPNGDGKNDRWVVNNLSSYPDNEVTIYDRAGRIVYHRKNYSNDWDGTVSGNPLAEGTYYYILTIKDNNTTVKGFITILRDK